MAVILIAMVVGLAALLRLGQRTGHGWRGLLLAFAPFLLAVMALIWRSTYIDGPDIIGVFAYLPAGILAGFVIVSFKPWPAPPAHRP